MASPKLKVTSLTLGRTCNLGNFDNVRFDITIKLDKPEEYPLAFVALQKEVDSVERSLRDEYKNKQLH